MGRSVKIFRVYDVDFMGELGFSLVALLCLFAVCAFFVFFCLVVVLF